MTSQNEKKVIPTIAEFMAQLSSLDIKLWLDEEHLRCNAPKGVLTPSLKTQLRDRKAEIMDFLGNKSDNSQISELLEADAVVDDSIQPNLSLSPILNPNRILLTGATGFLGAFLLSELLKQTSADIYCLVRADSTDKASTKLINRLKSSLLWEQDFQSRIIPVVGDLSKSLLGLAESKFQELATNIDAIYHNGAWVHHVSPYSVLRDANVGGTREILRLACQTKVKPVHFTSTASVLNTNESGERIIREQDSIDSVQVAPNGYVQSKWVAEKLVKAAGDRGLPISNYRDGRNSGDSRTGVFTVNDYLYRLIIGCVELSSIPDVELIQDIIPVDYAVRAIIHLSLQQNSWGQTFHLTHPQPVSTNIFYEKLLTLGYPIQKIPYEQWHQQLLNIAANNPEHALYPLVSLLFGKSSSDSSTPASDPAVVKYDCQNTLDGLRNTSISCPAIDEQLLDIYFSYMIEHGFIVPPPIQERPPMKQESLIST